MRFIVFYFFAYKTVTFGQHQFSLVLFSAFVFDELVKLVSHDNIEITRSICKRHTECNLSFSYFYTNNKSCKCEVSYVGNSPCDKTDNNNNIYR